MESEMEKISESTTVFDKDGMTMDINVGDMHCRIKHTRHDDGTITTELFGDDQCREKFVDGTGTFQDQ